MSAERDRLLAAAATAQRSGQFDSARRFAQGALDIDSNCIPAKFLLGVAYARQGDLIEAEAMFCQVLAADPRAYEALISLATVYRDLERWDEAIAAGMRAVALRPSDAQAHNNLGRSALAARRLDQAAAAFMKSIALQPAFSAAHFNLGKTRQLEGRDGEAAAAFAQAAQLAPTSENLQALGQMLLTLCDFESALDCGRKCVALFPDSAAAHLLLCGALTDTQDLESAERHLRRAIELDPDGREALHLAARQRPLGYIDEANENLRRAIDLNPRLVSAYDSLMQNHRVTETDRELVEKMLALLDHGGLSPTELVSIHYGLGKAMEDLADYEASMRHYDEANRITRLLKFGTAPFDEGKYGSHVDRMIREFTPSSAFAASSESSDVPILVIGMMRSGTSLTEQILSSHRDVAGAGERLYWSRNWPRAGSDGPTALGREFVRDIRQFGPNSKRITDKMPGNYMFAGLIHQALPNAKIIHIRRNPADTCMSIWATPNHTPQEGGHDKGNIVTVYREYQRLMKHWRRCIPDDRLLEVDYEDLVAHPEPVIRRMLSFCELEWDEACLQPHKTKRLVATPSAWQVRQPFYSSSVARWKRFEPWLGDFRALIDPLSA